MDIEEMLARLDAGASTVGTIEVEILAEAESYRKPGPSPDSDAEFAGLVERRYDLGLSLNRLLESIRAETDPQKVLERGRILVTAAGLLQSESAMTANYHVGNHLARLRACEEALPFVERAETLYNQDETKREKIQVDLVALKIICLETLHRHPELEAYARQLLRDYAAEGFRRAHSLFYRILAEACLNQGKFDEAVDACRKGLEVLGASAGDGDSFDGERARFYSFLGWASRSANRLAEALAAFESARSLALRGGDPDAAATALSEIGITWYQFGEERRAWDILEQAAKEAEAINHPQDAARWRATLPPKTEPAEGDSTIQILVWAAALMRQQPPRTAEARRLALMCIPKAKSEGDWRTELDARTVLARTYEADSNYFQAVAALKTVVQIASSKTDRAREITFRTNLGNVLYKAGRIWDAEHELNAAIEIGRAARAAARAAEIRQAISALLRHAYEMLAVVLAQSWEGKDGRVLERRSDKLLELLQSARAGNFAGWVAADKAIGERGLAELYDPLLKLRASDVRIEMSALSSGAPLAPLLEEQERARRDFAAAAAARGLDADIEPPVYGVEELRRSLLPGECLVDLYGFISDVMVTLLRPEGELESLFVKWPEEERVALLRRWQSRVSAEGDPGRRHRRPRRLQAGLPQGEIGPDFPAPEAPLAVLLKELGERFTDRLAEALAARGVPERVIVVPSNELALVPYWVLASRLPGLKVSVAPGANVYKLLRERRRGTQGPRLAIGDPTGSLPYAPAELESLPGFELLPSEIDEILRRAREANVVHFSGHGIFNERNPYLSGLIAQRRPGRVPRPFGARVEIFNYELLTVAEVLAQAHLPECFLVTLSACSTGLPRQHPANEFIGLPAAFLIAGARNVMGSLWPVDDAATSVMMREFYARLMRDGAFVSTPSAALSGARERLGRMTRAEVLSLGLKPEDVPDLEFPYAGPEYTLAFQHFGVD